jgi:hypothetical protein
MPTGEAKKAIAPTAPRTGSLAPRATQTLHPCLASVCPSTDDPITDIRGRDGTPFTHSAPVSRRAACRKLTSQGRQIREKPVTVLTLCSQPLELESSQRTSAATRPNSWRIKHASLRKVNGHNQWRGKPRAPTGTNQRNALLLRPCTTTGLIFRATSKHSQPHRSRVWPPQPND